jgi:hypothetical protein
MGITSEEIIPHKTGISKPQLFSENSIATWVKYSQQALIISARDMNLKERGYYGKR